MHRIAFVGFRSVWRNLSMGALAGALLALSGCYSAPIMPPVGLLYTGVEAPVSAAAVGQNLGSRKGRSSSAAVLGLFAWGDSSVKAAAENGGISQLKHIDYRFFHVLGIYQEFTTVVYGD